MLNVDLLKGLEPGEAERVMALGKRMVLTPAGERLHDRMVVNRCPTNAAKPSSDLTL